MSMFTGKLPENAEFLSVPSKVLDVCNLEGLMTKLCHTVAKQGNVLTELNQRMGVDEAARLDALEQDVRLAQTVQRDTVKWLEGFKGQIQGIKRTAKSQQRELDELRMMIKRPQTGGGAAGMALGDLSEMMAQEMDEAAARMSTPEDDEFDLNLPSLSEMSHRALHKHVVSKASIQELAESSAGQLWMEDRLGLKKDEPATEPVESEAALKARRWQEEAAEKQLAREQDQMLAKFEGMQHMQSAGRCVAVWKLKIKLAKHAEELRVHEEETNQANLLRAQQEAEKVKAEQRQHEIKAATQAATQAAAQAAAQSALTASAGSLGAATAAEVDQIVQKQVEQTAADLRKLMASELGSAGVRIAKQMEGPLNTLKELYNDMQKSLDSQVEQDEEHDRLFVEAFEGIRKLEGQHSQLNQQLIDYGSLQSPSATMEQFKQELATMCASVEARILKPEPIQQTPPLKGLEELRDSVLHGSPQAVEAMLTSDMADALDLKDEDVTIGETAEGNMLAESKGAASAATQVGSKNPTPQASKNPTPQASKNPTPQASKEPTPRECKRRSSLPFVEVGSKESTPRQPKRRSSLSFLEAGSKESTPRQTSREHKRRLSVASRGGRTPRPGKTPRLSPREVLELREELRAMQQSAEGIHGVVAAQGGQIALLELAAQGGEADMSEVEALLDDMEARVEDKLSQMIDTAALGELQEQISRLCSKLEGDIADCDKETVEVTQNLESTGSIRLDPEVVTQCEPQGSAGVSDSLGDGEKLLETNTIAATHVGSCGGLRGLLNSYTKAILLIEHRETSHASRLESSVELLRTSMSSMLSSAVSTDLAARVDQIKKQLESKVEVHEVAQLNQDIAKVAQDYSDFGAILESTTRTVTILDRKVTTDLEKVQATLKDFDPSNVDVMAPLMLVNSIVPHSGGCVGGYTVTVGRTGGSSGRDSVSPVQHAVARSVASAGLACPKMSKDEREQYKRLIPSYREAQAPGMRTQSVAERSEAEWKKQLATGSPSSKLPRIRSNCKGQRPQTSQANHDRPHTSHSCGSRQSSTGSDLNRPVDLDSKSRVEVVVPMAPPELPPLLSSGSMVYLAPPPAEI